MKINQFYYPTILLLFVFQFSFCQVVDELKAFPSAEGAGKYVNGGRGGAVFKVKNLNTTGSESINQVMENGQKGYVVFDVAGLITFSATGDALYPNTDLTNGKTVLGQSAFRNGGQGMVIRGSSSYSQPLVRGAFGNLIWRGGIFRRGIGDKDATGLNSGETSGDNFEPYNSKGKGKIILDHMSFSWSTDENVSFATMDGYTLQYSIIMEGLYYATHQYTRDVNNSAYQSGHSKGSLTSDVPDITHFGNLYVSNDDRNPLVQAMEDGITNVEIINNVFYNWGIFAVQFSLYDKYPRSLNQLDGTFNADVIGNIWKKGPNTTPIRLGFLWPDRDTFNGDAVLHYNDQKLFVSDNNSTFYSGDNWDVVGAWDDNTNAISKADHQTTTRNVGFTDDASILSSSGLVTSLFSHVGATAFGTARDAHDQRAIDDYNNNTGQIVNQDGWFETEAHYGVGDNFTDATGGWGTVNGMSQEPIDANNNGIEDNLEVSGATFPNDIQIPNELSLTGSHNQVLPYYYKASTGEKWYNPGYELIEVRYFNSLDVQAMTWVTTLSITDYQNEMGKVKIFPNPADNEITVQLPISINYTSFNLYTINGLLIKKSIISENQKTIIIPVDYLENSLYLIKFYNEKGDFKYMKILKE